MTIYSQLHKNARESNARTHCFNTQNTNIETLKYQLHKGTINQRNLYPTDAGSQLAGSLNSEVVLSQFRRRHPNNLSRLTIESTQKRLTLIG